MSLSKLSRYLVLVAAVGVIAWGCGGNSSPTSSNHNNTTTCGVTLTGAVTGSYTCTAVLAAQSGDSCAVGCEIQGTPTIEIGVEFLGTMHTGTFKNTDAGEIGGVEVVSGASQWVASDGTGQDQGTYTLIITSLGTSISANGQTAWPSVHGSLTASCPAVPGTSASGTVTVSSSF